MLTEKLGDLYLAQGKPSSAVHAYRQALPLASSPQQKIRLLLTIGERLSALGRTEEAYADYQQLLQDFPNYPEPLALYQKLRPLALKLGKQAEAENYQAEINRLSPPPPPAPASPPAESKPAKP